MPVPILREGKLGGYYHDPESARRHDARPTGHVVGDTLVPSNLVVRKGNRSRTQMLGEVPVAVFLDHLDGKIDLSTGAIDLHGPATLLEHGKPKGVVPEVILRGNICEFLSGVVELSSDQERTGHVDCATTLIKGFPVLAG
jgi:predicted Zn-dependent protease